MIDRLARPRLVVEVLESDGSVTHDVACDSAGRHRVGPLEVELAVDGYHIGWSVANPGSEPVRVMSIGVAWDAGPGGDDPRFFRNGYQSWSPASVARLGVDADPSTVEGTIGLVRQMHHADPRVALPGHRGLCVPLLVSAAASMRPHSSARSASPSSRWFRPSTSG